MRLHFSVGVYRVFRDREDHWIGLVPPPHTANISGTSELHLRERMIDRLRALLRETPPRHQELFQLPLATELMFVDFDLKHESGRITGVLPLIVEPRWVDGDRQRLFVYHPERRFEWFLAEDRAEVEQLAPAFVRHYWKALDEDDLRELLSNGSEALRTVAFSAEPLQLIDQLPSRKKPPTAAFTPRPEQVLQQIGVDETQRHSGNTVALGAPRSPYREQLAYLLGGQRPRSVAVIGPPGSGKTSLIHQWINDRLVEDGYRLHKNLDRVMRVWRIAGKRMIAGMSHLGQWEERCLGLLDELRKKRGILWIEDLYLWGRLGQSRESERSFAAFFRGPIRRGDLAVIAELTAEQFARLERDAPGLAEALAIVTVTPASANETARLLLHEIRAVEAKHPIALHPFVPRTALELGSALFPWRARPGVAIEIVRRVVDQAIAARLDREITPHDVLDQVARTTGLSAKLISLDEPLDGDDVGRSFARRVIGQPAATRAAADLVLRVRSGLADPNRPIQVMLFTGPTGTGKTELATAIAEYLYGGGERLIRVDMGEMSGGDAVARLIGDRWNPQGLLTSRIRAQPFSVVLLDEVEKAHPQVLHLLLQLFDEGRLTDANGDVASFASSVVIMTSNLGSRTAAPIGFGDARDRILADVAKAVREFFPIELFNRIDLVVPFEPLTPEVAAQVVDKELAKLLARRGLRERNTFVYAGTAIRRRAVADAFDPRYGARTVKRWLEDNIGGALTDLLASAPAARLRVVRLSEDRGHIVGTLEPMSERVTDAGPYALDNTLDVATSGLDGATTIAVAALGRITRDPMIERARSASGELAYYSEELRQRLAALRGLLDPANAERDDASAGHDDDDHSGIRTRVAAHARSVRPQPSRDALIAAIAEVLLIERGLPEFLDPTAHAVTVMISRVGTTADASGLAIVAGTLAQPGWFDSPGSAGVRSTSQAPGWIDGAAYVDLDGVVHELREPPTAPRPKGGSAITSSLKHLVAAAKEHHASPAVLGQLAMLGGAAGAPATDVLGRARDVCLVLRGLFVRRALANEHGTWMIRAAASEPDIVRVAVVAGADRSPVEAIRNHLAARRALERALEQGGALPPNPDVVLPVTRTLAYRPPLRGGESFHVELEDFATGWVDRGPVRDLASAIRRAWYLAWSRHSRTEGAR